MASIRENVNFTEAILKTYPLDEAIDWISNNMKPEDVFTEDRLEQWAKDSNYTKEGI